MSSPGQDATPLFDVQGDAAPPADPLAVARQWLPADDDPDRPRVTLATTGVDGSPDARTVLLSAVDDSGFAFHTAAGSRKVAELAASPHAAMVVLWPDGRRQLVVRGDVVPDDPDSAAAAWGARSDYLRRLAWLNTDELAGLSRAERRSRWAEFVPGTPAPADSWVGYRLRPLELTYWAAADDGPSRRLQYLRSPAGWTCRQRAG